MLTLQELPLLSSYANSDTNVTPALFCAASANNGKAIELILETSTVSIETLPMLNPSSVESQEHTPFVLMNGLDERNRTALITAAWGDCGAAAKAICQDSRIDVHSCDRSALQISVLECHTDFLESILERDDLDVNVRGLGKRLL